MNCLEDADISIRLLALELSVKMIDSNTLQPVVNRLISQLDGSAFVVPGDPPINAECLKAVDPATLSQCGDLEEQNGPNYNEPGRASLLPIDYRIEVLHRILDVCSFNNYSTLQDFEWYIGVLVHLVRLLPSDVRNYPLQPTAHEQTTHGAKGDIASRIGSEIRNVAVRVRNVRIKATRVAESLVLVDNRKSWLPINNGNGILGPLAWVVGEYAEFLLYPGRALNSLIDISNTSLPARTLSLYIQAIPKVFIHLAYGSQSWSLAKKTESSLLLARVVEFLEALAAHPDLDVQERAIEFLETLRLAADAIQSGTYQPEEVPFLLSAVIPSLFSGLELNPVAASAQKKVPLPERLALDNSITGNLYSIFSECGDWPRDLRSQDHAKLFYCVRDIPVLEDQPTEFAQLDIQAGPSYQDHGVHIGDMAGVVKRKVERTERNKEDPFYIGTEERSSEKSTPLHQAPNAINGEEINIDAIPVIDLRIDDSGVSPLDSIVNHGGCGRHASHSKKYHVVADETIGYEEPPGVSSGLKNIDRFGNSKYPLLQVDSSGLGHLPLEAASTREPDTHQNLAIIDRDEEDMVRAMHEVEKARLEMQRESERTYSGGMPAEGMLVSKRKKGRKPIAQEAIDNNQHGDRPT